MFLSNEPGGSKYGYGSKITAPKIAVSSAKWTGGSYAKPVGAAGLPGWFKQIRAGSDFMPAKVKPLSYNFMSLVETPQRRSIYAPANVRTDVGTKYHRPTDAVATELNKNLTIWQDIKNLGGKVLGHGINLLGRVGDILSRPAYAMRNMYLEDTKYNYMNPNSAGGSSVTGWEFARSLIKNVTPVGTLKDLFTGRLDDRLYAGWQGLSGKKKIFNSDLLTEITPGWAAKHKGLTQWGGLAADIVLDPVTWLTMGMNPGSVTRLGGAGIKALKLDKVGAIEALDNTLFTSAGRSNAYAAMRSDAIARKHNQLLRQANRALSKSDKRTAGTLFKKADEEAAKLYKAKADELADKWSTFAEQDLKGANLARLMIRQNINPFVAVQTASRLTTGAAKGSAAIKTEQTVRDVMNAYHESLVDKFVENPNWEAAYEMFKGRDLNYTHGQSGKNYPVKLSEAEDFRDWMSMIVKEAAPVAKVGEQGVKEARVRKGKIVVVESRAKDFINTLKNDFNMGFRESMTKDQRHFFDNPDLMDVKAASKKDMENPSIPKLDEEAFNKLTPDQLLKYVDDHWKQKGNAPKGAKAKRVIVVDDTGKGRIIDVEATVAHARRSQRATASSAAAHASSSTRTAAQVATDTLSGVDDALAVRREELVQHFASTRALSPKHATAVDKFINNIMDYISKDDFNRLNKILNDEKRPLEERIAQIIADPSISDRVIDELVKDFFDIKIVNGKIKIKAHESISNEDALSKLPEVMRAVLMDRWQHRVVDIGAIDPATGEYLASALTKGSNIEMKEGKIYVKGKAAGDVNPNYQRDINGEIASAIIGGWRAGLHAATKMHLFSAEDGPRLVFQTMMDSMSEATNLLTADVKAQVMQLMYNMSGLRLPEGFVPSSNKVKLLVNGDPVIIKRLEDGTNELAPFEFRTAKGEPAKDQARVWNQLFVEMQGWLGKLFDDHVIELKNADGGGYDINAFGTTINDMVAAPFPANVSDTSQRLHNKLVTEILALKDRVGTPENSLINGNIEVINSYSMMDFLLHHKEILKAQTTSLRQVDTGKKIPVETTVGTVMQPQVITRLNIGRLSALDSFGFVDDEIKRGLEALNTLKNIANRKEATEEVVLARKALAQLFIESGGQEYMINMLNPRSTDTKNIVTQNLKSLGSHAALKEQALLGKGTKTRRGSGFGPAYAGQLMEALWDAETVNHEFQKALQNSIMGRVILNGESPESIAKQMAKSIDEQFHNDAMLNKILHPTVGKGAEARIAEPSAQKGLATRLAGKQENRNPVRFEYANPTNMVEDAAPEITIPTGLTEVSSLNAVTVPNGKTLTEVLAHNGIVLPKEFKNTVSAARIVDGDYKNGVVVLRKGPPGKKYAYYIAPGAEPYKLTGSYETLKPLLAAFNEALKNPAVAAKRYGKDDGRYAEQFTPNAVLEQPRHMEVMPVAPGSRTNPVMESMEAPVKSAIQGKMFERREAVPTPTPAPESAAASAQAAIPEGALSAEADVNITGNMENPADFANVGDAVAYTDEQKAVIREWIGKQYAQHPPAAVAAELHKFTTTLAGDLYLAQSSMISHMSDLSLQHKTSIRFMGAPFMNIGNPINANQSLAGITMYNEKRSRAIQMWHSILAKSDPGTKNNPMAQVRREGTRQSNLLNEGLNRIYSKVVNSVAESRKTLVTRINENGRDLLKGEYAYAPFNNLNRKQRMVKIATAMFDPAVAKQPDALDIFDLADGTNPVKTAVGHLNDAAETIFADLGRDSDEWGHAFNTFNRYMPKQFKLDEGELRLSMSVSKGMQELPFTRDWYIAMAEHPQMKATKLNVDHMKQVNVVALQMNQYDSALRLLEGRKLNDAIWSEYAFKMDKSSAKYWNDEIVPNTLDRDGSTMRGRVVRLADVKDGIDTKHVIDAKYIPKKFTDTEIDHYYVDESLLPDIKTLVRFMEGVSDINTKIDTKFLHKILNYFKQSVTIYKIPTYPVRNLMSDVFLSAMDGLTNPRHYRDSARIMQSAHKDSKVIDETHFTDLIDRGYMQDELARNMNDPDFQLDPTLTAAPITTTLRGMNGTEYKLNDHQIMSLYTEMGLGMNRVSADVRESVATTRLTGAGRAFGAAHDKARLINDWREDWGRMAHFTYALEMEAPMGGDLIDIARRAGNRVMKHHFDYNDVSLFGRLRWGQIVPFYKWIRNIIPYTIASVVTKPYMIKTEMAINKGMGMALDDNPDDPRTDFVVPDYIQRDTPVDIGWYSDPNGNKFMQWMGVSLPLSETFAGSLTPIFGPMVNPSGGSIKDRAGNVGSGAIRVFAGSTNPLLSGTIQALTGRQVWPNGPSAVDSPTSWFETMTDAIPGLPMIRDLERQAGKLTSPGSDRNQAAALLAALGVIKVRDNTEKSQLGEIRRIEDMNRAQRNQLLGPIKNKIKNKWPQLTPDQVDELTDIYLKGLRQQAGVS